MLAPLRLISSMAAREVLAELSAQFTSATGVPVNAEAAGGVEVARRVAAGEAADVVVLASTAIDRLIADGRLQPGRVDLVRSGVAIAVRTGAARPDIGSEQAVRRAVEAARSVSYSTGPSGVHLEKVFARWGVLDALRPRIVVPAPGVPVGTLVAGGQAELGFQQLSELLTLPGIDVLGPLPPSIQSITTFSGGVCVQSAQAEGAWALLAFMAAPAAAQVKQRFGMEPA
ncbi:MAG TPA: substrate-binding domain-containing protein [Steroidobacteraceae bacterium]|nr:substrate-binding domain-containing protein [Steroidobacteraceae bacterium]